MDKKPDDKRSELKPCPFCGSKQVEYEKAEDFGGTYVECYNCGVTSPVVANKEKAAAVWNRRADGV